MNLADPSGRFDRPTAQQVAQLRAAISFVRASSFPGAAGISNDLTRMLGRGQFDVLADPDGDERAHTPILLWTTVSNVTTYIRAKMFDAAYPPAGMRPAKRFIDDLRLASTLVHEHVHAMQQGFWWAKLHPNEKEARAYGVELRFLQAVRSDCHNTRWKVAAVNATMEDFIQ